MTTRQPYERPPPTVHTPRPSPEEEARREVAQDMRAAFRDLGIGVLVALTIFVALGLRFGIF